MVKLILDGRELDVADGTTIFQAASEAGVAIPHFCYHPAFAPEGSCRLCLVEVEGSPKLELSCSTPVKEGMRVRTSGEKVAAARREILELFLAEHPLDCPICDKAGECDLQDYYRAYGLTPAVFEEPKQRRAKKVPLGKNLVLDRERCVLCTRCVRFLEQVTRTGELGVFERGSGSEVSTLDGNPVNNNYSGCLAEICPVGAITDTDFRFKTRAWLLERAPSICPGCGRGCAVTIEHSPGIPRAAGSRKVYRVRARFDPEVNGHWICDLGRYGYASLDRGRRERIAVKADGVLRESDWDAAIRAVADSLGTIAAGPGPARIAVLASSALTNEELFLVRRIFLDGLKVHKLFLVDPPDGAPDGSLLTKERAPNTRGAAEAGLKLGSPDIGSLTGEIELVLLFGLGLLERWGDDRGRAFLRSAKKRILVSSLEPRDPEDFDVILPAAPPAEKSGSFTNIEGRVRCFEPVRPAGGRALPEWDVLLRLGRALGLETGLLSGLSGLEDVRRTLSSEVPFFQGRFSRT